MERDGYLSWDAVYRPGKVVATGYRKGRKVLVETVETTEKASAVALAADRTAIQADGRDLAVVTVCLKDRKGRFVPDACDWVTLKVDGPARILGVGNGDPAWQEKERPDDPDARTFRVKTFTGLAQVLVQSDGAPGAATLTVSGSGLASAALTMGFPSKNEK